ncbi:hypothetical protein T01_4034 [Trichinella spiralis]|uniref:Uncharacterized protein n=1 Tax=Trichinella spiralis TaxID=6334 RepID=A0A0V1BTI1_TRISP|nr:hypothetical protein T01_4034 [Trichinella spiralis]
MALLWEMFYVRTKSSPFMLRFDCLPNSFDMREEEAPSVCNDSSYCSWFQENVPVFFHTVHPEERYLSSYFNQAEDHAHSRIPPMLL